jgi:hypothetical protein
VKSSVEQRFLGATAGSSSSVNCRLGLLAYLTAGRASSGTRILSVGAALGARLVFALVLMLAAFADIAIGAPPRLLLADGIPVEAGLAEAATDGKLAFATAGKRVSPEARNLVRWGQFLSPGGSGALAVFDRGDLLLFTSCTVVGEELQLATDTFGVICVPLAATRGLVFQPPGDVLERDRLFDELLRPAKDLSAAIASGLRVTLDNGDIVDGKLASLSADELVIDAATGKLTLGVERVRAIAFRPSEERTKNSRGLRFVVGTTDGSRVTAAELGLTAEGLQLTMPAGAKWNLARDKVAAIQTLGGKATYLSDIAASGYKYVPYLATTWPLANDRSVGGGWLRAPGGEYLKGLGMHSAASATYALDKPYRRFEAELAIDDSSQQQDGGGITKLGSVIFRVYVDTGDGSWKLRHTSETIRGGEAPTPVSVDLAGAKRLSLIVDFADRADEGDRADWLDARLIE